MIPIPKQSFPYHVGKNLSISKIDYQKQDLADFFQCQVLGTYLFLVVDENCNFHFIQYRDPKPEEPIIQSPSIAQTGHGRIKFTLQYSRLRSFLLKEPITERDFRFHSKENQKGELEITSLGDNRILVKLHEDDPVFIIYFDHRLDTEIPIKLDSMEGARNFEAFGQSKISFYQSSQVVLLCPSTKQSQILNFTRPEDVNDQLCLPSKGIVIGVYDDLIEVLDVHTNTVVETLFFAEDELVCSEVENHFDGNKFAMIYKIEEDEEETKFFLRVWKINNDLSLQSFQELELETFDENCSFDFIGKDQIALLDKSNNLTIFRIEEEKSPQIRQISEIELPMQNKEETQSEFYLVYFLDDQHFITWVEDLIHDCTRTKTLLFTHPPKSSKKKGKFNKEQAEKIEKRRLSFDSFDDDFNFEMSIIYETQPDPISGITHWEDQYLLFMTMSQKLMHYDLHTGKLKQVFSLIGVLPHNWTLMKIACVKKNHFVLAFEKDEGEKCRILVFDLLMKKTLFDSQNDLKDEIVSLSNLEVRYGRIIFCREKKGRFGMVIAELDYLEKKASDIRTFEDIYRLQLSDEGTLIAEGEANKICVISLKERFGSVLNQFKAGEILKNLNIKGSANDWIFVSNEIVVISYSKYSGKKKLASDREDKRKGESESEEDSQSFLVFWDITQQSIMEEITLRLDFEKFLCCHNGLLFYLYGANNYLGFFSFEKILRTKRNQGKQKDKELQDQLGLNPMEKSDLEVEEEYFESLDDKRVIASLYQKDIFPNSLLLLRKRNIKLEWLNVVHKCLKDKYQKYVILDVMAMIFCSNKLNMK